MLPLGQQSAKMYETKKDKPFYSSMNILIIFGILPRSFESDDLRKFYIRKFMMTAGTIVGCCTLNLLHLVMNKRANYDIDFSEDISLLVSSTTIVVVNCLFTLQYPKWFKLFNDLTALLKHSVPNDYLKTVKRFNIIALCYVFYVNFAECVYFYTSYIESKGCERINLEKNMTLFCLSLTPIWLPFEVKSRYWQFLIFGMQAIVVFTPITSAAIACLIPREFAEIITSHTRNLKKLIVEALQEESEAKKIMKVKLWIKYYADVQRLILELNKLTKVYSAPMSGVAAICFGSIANQTVRKSKTLGAMEHLTGWVLALFVLCDAGQKITDETESIGNAIYSSEWYNANNFLQKDLNILLANTQKPMHLNAFPIGWYDYSLFLMILKTSYSFLTLLLNTT